VLRVDWKDAPLMGTIAKAAAASSPGGSSFIIILAIAFIGFYFLIIRPQRNRQRKVVEQQKTATPGARVRTTAGMYATVVAVDGDDVVLEVAPGIEVRYMRRAVMEVLSDGEEAEPEETEDEDTEPEDAEAFDSAETEDAEPEDAETEHSDSGSELTHPIVDGKVAESASGSSKD
jgi:preprotein translocase subunit YajC